MTRTGLEPTRAKTVDATRSGALAPLVDPGCLGLASIGLVARDPFWDPQELPFSMHGAGVLRVVPAKGFRKELLAATPDELAVIPDCPDAPGWLVPEGLVGRWMARNVVNDVLDDALLSHPLYSHLVKPDPAGHSRAGRARLASWVPGVPTHAHVQGPEFLPGDRRAPVVNRVRAKYAAACEDLLSRLDDAFDLAEVELSFAFGETP